PGRPRGRAPPPPPEPNGSPAARGRQCTGSASPPRCRARLSREDWTRFRMDIRLAAQADLPAVRDLLEALYIDNLSEAERTQGFLSVRFTLEDLAQMGIEAGLCMAAGGPEEGV